MTETILKTIKCDICNKTLKENEIESGKGMFGFTENPNKPVSKSGYKLKLDGMINKPKDLCFSCGKKIRDYIEKLKVETI